VLQPSAPLRLCVKKTTLSVRQSISDGRSPGHRGRTARQP